MILLIITSKNKNNNILFDGELLFSQICVCLQDIKLVRLFLVAGSINGLQQQIIP